MTEDRDPFKRTGHPGGPGCTLTALGIELNRDDGSAEPGKLLNAGPGSELEMLRTIASNLGVRWGKDETGWWAAVPDRLVEGSSKPEQ